jgi:hypothetical protein
MLVIDKPDWNKGDSKDVPKKPDFVLRTIPVEKISGG